jgi:hypothetical protein
MYIQTTKTEQADKHTRKETTKITKENRGKTQMEKAARQKGRRGSVENKKDEGERR